MKLIVIVIALVITIPIPGHSQMKLIIKISDTIDNTEYCRLTVFMKSSKKINFPTNPKFGDLISNSDFLYEIERKEKGHYKSYSCQGTYELPVNIFHTDTLKTSIIKDAVYSDSMQSIGCIETGNFRIRVLYNRRNKLIGPERKIMAKIRWQYFYVAKYINLRKF